MALNTPKRVRTSLETYVSSPPCSGSGGGYHQPHYPPHQYTDATPAIPQPISQHSGHMDPAQWQQFPPHQAQPTHPHQQQPPPPSSVHLPSSPLPAGATPMQHPHHGTAAVGTPTTTAGTGGNGTHAQWLPELALSPASSSCGSPEFHGPYRHAAASHTQQFQPSTGAGTGIVSALAYTSGGSVGSVSGSGGGGGNSNNNENSRRGRPRSEAISTLMIEGSTSPSAIKCGFCHRVFPREKSLQAHLRTHTGKTTLMPECAHTKNGHTRGLCCSICNFRNAHAHARTRGSIILWL